MTSDNFFSHFEAKKKNKSHVGRCCIMKCSGENMQEGSYAEKKYRLLLSASSESDAELLQDKNNQSPHHI